MQPDDGIRNILDVDAKPQDQSPLFRYFPPEVRSRIWAFTLAIAPDTDPAWQYDLATPYIRPGYTAPRRVYTDLLQTCRAVFEECWFMVADYFEHAVWVTSANHTPIGEGPPRTDEQRAALRGPRGGIGRMRLFVRVSELERGALYPALWHARFLRPETVTVTLAHASWPDWHRDRPLRLGAGWTRDFGESLQDRVREVYIELETAERKADQARELAAQMMRKWFIVRQDYKKMFADRVEESRWRGTSAWNHRRWKREEIQPGVMNYVVVAVRFRLEEDMTAEALKQISKFARAMSEKYAVCECKLDLKLPDREVPQNPEMSVPRPKTLPAPFPSWIQLPRVIMEANDLHAERENSDDSTAEYDDACECTKPRLKIRRPVSIPLSTGSMRSDGLSPDSIPQYLQEWPEGIHFPLPEDIQDIEDL